jgi:integrase
VVFKSPKSDSGRTVEIPADLVPVLADHLSEHVGPKANALVFTSPEGHPLRRTKFRPRWAAACQSAGVSGLHFHDLRGSGATWAAIAGATLPELMHRLGVLPDHVVESADGWAPDGRVVPMMVVHVKPGVQRSGPGGL